MYCVKTISSYTTDYRIFFELEKYELLYNHDIISTKHIEIIIH